MQHGRPLQTEEKLNLTLIINKQEQKNILWNQEQGNISEDIDFFHSLEIYLKDTGENYWTPLLKTASKKLVYKTAEATEELIGNNFCDKIVKPMSHINSRNTEEIVIPEEERHVKWKWKC